MSFDDIAKVTGKGKRSIEKIMQLDRVNAPLYRALADGKLSPAVAELITKLDPAVQKELSEELDEKGRLTEDSVRAARAVRRGRSVAALPASVFQTPARIDWRLAVESKLRDAIALVPAGPAHDPVRAAIEEALLSTRTGLAPSGPLEPTSDATEKGSVHPLSRPLLDQARKCSMIQVGAYLP